MNHWIRVVIRFGNGTIVSKVFEQPAPAATWIAEEWVHSLPTGCKVHWYPVPAPTPVKPPTA